MVAFLGTNLVNKYHINKVDLSDFCMLSSCEISATVSPSRKGLPPMVFLIWFPQGDNVTLPNQFLRQMPVVAPKYVWHETYLRIRRRLPKTLLAQSM